MKDTTIRIKKYANRRMYDTSASRYVNLEEIAAMVRNGKDVEIVDAKTGEDLTRMTLTQVIMESAKDQPTGLPLEVLKQLIVASDQVGQEFLGWYLKSAFENYQSLQSAVRGGLSNMQSAAMSPLSMMRSFLQGPAAAPAPKAEESELEGLRRRVAEMEARQSQSKKTKKKSARKS